MMRIFLSLALSMSLATYAQVPAAQTPEPAKIPAPETLPPPGGNITMPAGTTIQLTLTNPLFSVNALAGDVVHAEVAFPVVIAERLAIPRGSVVEGRVTRVTRPGFSHHAKIEMQFTRITFENGYTVSLNGATARVSDELPSAPGAPVTGDLAATNDGNARSGNRTNASLARATIAPFAMLLFQTPVPPTLPPLPKQPGTPTGFIIGAAVGAAAIAAVAIYGIRHRGGELYLDYGWQIDMVLQTPVEIEAERAFAPVT